MAKELNNLNWIEALLPKDFIRKPMFGGFAYYSDNRMVLAMFESQEPRSNWNGCLFPSEREFHSAILKKFSYLSNHPVLPKWLYLPQDSENFETHAEDLLKEIRRRSPFFGVIPKAKKAKQKNSVIQNEKIDTRKPRMFSDVPVEVVIKGAVKISDLKNLGPASEKVFHKAGIKTVAQFVKLGWKGAMKKLAKSDSRNIHAMFAYAVIGALKNREWSGISESEKAEARSFMNELRTVKKT